MSWLTDRLTRLMAERGLTVDAVARQLAIERSRLANIIAGSAIPNESLTRRIARLFGEDADAWLSHVQKPAEEKPGRLDASGDHKRCQFRQVFQRS